MPRHLAQLVQASLQGGSFFFNGLQHVGDQAELGVHAGDRPQCRARGRS